MKKLALLCLPLVLLVSCRQEIVDFFEAIQDYGYRSLQPLGPKNVPVNQNLLGGYVYDELPVIISQKDANTYQIKFLTVLLYKEDVVIDAHATQLGGATFLNLAMGDYYCFMRINLALSELEISLLKEAVKTYIPEKELKSWLQKNPSENVVYYTEAGTEYSMDVYFSFVFTKVSIDEAYRIQKERLRLARMDLFSRCDSYEEYERLKAQYPNDEFLPLAEESLLLECETIADFEAFVKYFPQSSWSEQAKVEIARLKEEERQRMLAQQDREGFAKAVQVNTIDAYEAFLAACHSQIYKDSAQARIVDRAQHISAEDIEWKWTNGDREGALRLLDYAAMYHSSNFENPPLQWIILKETEYSLMLSNVDRTRKTMQTFDKLVEKRVSGDDYLYIVVCKGFLLWSIGEIDLAVQTFEIKLGFTFDDDHSLVKEKIAVLYESYVEKGITFPDQKANWKRIKKLKIE